MTILLLLCSSLSQAPGGTGSTPSAAAAPDPRIDPSEAGAIRAVIKGGPQAVLHGGEEMAPTAPPPSAARAPNAAPSQGATGVVVEDPNDPAFLIGKEIRCPVCQGMSIADSPSEMSQDMMKQVRTMHASGKSKDEIFAHFTAAYGDWVLLKPKASGVTWLVWLLPPLGLLLAILGIRSYIRSSKAQTAAPASKAEPQNDEGDEYLKLIRNEVER